MTQQRANRSESLDLGLARRVFTLDRKDWDAFVAALDAPARSHPRLERLFREASVFEREK
jgi:uncharacterized protein (DUF1778 family)